MRGLFRKFFPDESLEKQQEFAQKLPEFKINMAKLQGHFLKYKNDVPGAIENALSLLDVEYQIKDMSINVRIHLTLPLFRNGLGDLTSTNSPISSRRMVSEEWWTSNTLVRGN
jgi:hypothetical protein